MWNMDNTKTDSFHNLPSTSTSRKTGGAELNVLSHHSFHSAPRHIKTGTSATVMANVNLVTGAQMPKHLTARHQVKLIRSTTTIGTGVRPNRATKGIHIIDVSLPKQGKSPKTIVRRYSATGKMIGSHGIVRVHSLGLRSKQHGMITRARSKIMKRHFAITHAGTVAQRYQKHASMSGTTSNTRRVTKVHGRALAAPHRREKPRLGNKKKGSQIKYKKLNSSLTTQTKMYNAIRRIIRTYTKPKTKRIKGLNAVAGSGMGAPRRRKLPLKAVKHIKRNVSVAKHTKSPKPRARKYSSRVVRSRKMTKVHKRAKVTVRTKQRKSKLKTRVRRYNTRGRMFGRAQSKITKRQNVVKNKKAPKLRTRKYGETGRVVRTRRMTRVHGRATVTRGMKQRKSSPKTGVRIYNARGRMFGTHRRMKFQSKHQAQSKITKRSNVAKNEKSSKLRTRKYDVIGGVILTRSRALSRVGGTARRITRVYSQLALVPRRQVTSRLGNQKEGSRSRSKSATQRKTSIKTRLRMNYNAGSSHRRTRRIGC